MWRRNRAGGRGTSRPVISLPLPWPGGAPTDPADVQTYSDLRTESNSFSCSLSSLVCSGIQGGTQPRGHQHSPSERPLCPQHCLPPRAPCRCFVAGVSAGVSERHGIEQRKEGGRRASGPEGQDRPSVRVHSAPSHALPTLLPGPVPPGVSPSLTVPGCVGSPRREVHSCPRAEIPPDPAASPCTSETLTSACPFPRAPRPGAWPASACRAASASAALTDGGPLVSWFTWLPAQAPPHTPSPRSSQHGVGLKPRESSVMGTGGRSHPVCVALPRLISSCARLSLARPEPRAWMPARESRAPGIGAADRAALALPPGDPGDRQDTVPRPHSRHVPGGPAGAPHREPCSAAGGAAGSFRFGPLSQ